MYWLLAGADVVLHCICQQWSTDNKVKQQKWSRWARQLKRNQVEEWVGVELLSSSRACVFVVRSDAILWYHHSPLRCSGRSIGFTSVNSNGNEKKGSKYSCCVLFNGTIVASQNGSEWFPCSSCIYTTCKVPNSIMFRCITIKLNLFVKTTILYRQ